MNILKSIEQKVFGVAKAEEVKKSEVTKDKLSPAKRHIHNYNQAGAFGGSRFITGAKDQKSKVKSGSKLMRKAMRKYGAHEVLMAMGGAYKAQGVHKHEGYPKMGAKSGYGKVYTMKAVTE